VQFEYKRTCTGYQNHDIRRTSFKKRYIWLPLPSLHNKYNLMKIYRMIRISISINMNLKQEYIPYKMLSSDDCTIIHCVYICILQQKR